MKANLYVKLTNILDRIQLHFDSIDLPKVGMHGSIFIHTSHPPVVTELKLDDATVILSGSAKPTLCERGNTSNCQLQKPQLARRHHSLNWRWQSQLMQWL